MGQISHLIDHVGAFHGVVDDLLTEDNDDSRAAAALENLLEVDGNSQENEVEDTEVLAEGVDNFRAATELESNENIQENEDEDDEVQVILEKVHKKPTHVGGGMDDFLTSDEFD